MPSVQIHPAKLKGPWYEGYVLEREHTTDSVRTGYDAKGQPQFRTTRSELGELVYQLKIKGNSSALLPIVETAVQSLKKWNPPVDMIVAVPPSRNRTGSQPVQEIVKAIARELGKPFNFTVVKKLKATPELKDVADYDERLRLLEGAFKVDVEKARARSILLIDDLYRSGATAASVTEALLKGGAQAVRFLAMTKTRTRT